MNANVPGNTLDHRGVAGVRRAELPLHCPRPGDSLWDAHPRVYLPIEATGTAQCPYCGAEYRLID